MTDTLQLNHTTVYSGLGTSAYTVAAAGTYSVSVMSTIPAGSSAAVVIKKNNTTIIDNGASATNPTPTQQYIAGQADILCAVSDVISVRVASASAVDAAPNAVKSTINLFQKLGA